MSLRSSAAHACAGEETCREEKKGDQGESKRGGQDRFHKGEARDQLGMRIPEADNSLQHPGFTGFDALHIEGLFTLAVFPPGLKGCSGQGAWWPSSIFLGGLGSRARQGPKYSSRSKQGSAHSLRSALFIHYLTRSSLAPLCVRPPLPQLLPNPFHSSFLLGSQGLLLPPLTFPWMQAALTDCRIACRKHRTFPAPQGSALCLPLPARQDSLGCGSSRFSATDYYRSPVQPVSFSLPSSTASQLWRSTGGSASIVFVGHF